MSAPTGVLAGDGLVSGVVMAAMAMGSVGLWTLRVTFAARGRKLLGAAVAAVEAVVFAMAFSNLTASLDAPVRVIGYAVGVAIGTVLGLSLDERASRGKSEMQRSSMETAGPVERLRPSASAVNVVPGRGAAGFSDGDVSRGRRCRGSTPGRRRTPRCQRPQAELGSGWCSSG